MMTVDALIASLSFKLLPRQDYVLVLPFAKATSGLIIQTAENREEPEAGIVLAVGPGKVGRESGSFTPVEAHIGEIVWYGRYAGVDFSVMGPAGPVRTLLMIDSTVMGYEPAGSYAITVHGDDPRKVHRAELLCDDCPKPERSFQEVERERLLAERREQDDAKVAIEAERERLRSAREVPEPAKID